jgi:hypothetical protein
LSVGRISLLRGFSRGWRKELGLSQVDGELNPPIDELTESLVGLQACGEMMHGVGADETTDLLTSMDIGQLAVWPVRLRIGGVVALAALLAAELVLP